MNLEKLTEKDTLLIELLSKNGSMTLSELSVRTLTPPSQILKIIEHIQRSGYIEIALVEESLENKAYFLNSNGRRLWAALRLTEVLR